MPVSTPGISIFSKNSQQWGLVWKHHWNDGRDSNPRPRDHVGRALPLCHNILVTGPMLPKWIEINLSGLCKPINKAWMDSSSSSSSSYKTGEILKREPLNNLSKFVSFSDRKRLRPVLGRFLDKDVQQQISGSFYLPLNLGSGGGIVVRATVS